MGRALVLAAEGWTGELGLRTLVVRSNAVRAESHGFYAGNGTTRVKTQHVYAKQL